MMSERQRPYGPGNRAGTGQGRGQGLGQGRGMGKGQGFGKGQGLGAGGQCLCPKCGFEKTHEPGLPCMNERCPSCGGALVRKGSDHHNKILAQKATKKTQEGS